MSAEALETIKRQAESLTSQEKLMLGHYLLEQARQAEPPPTDEQIRDQRSKRAAWLKANREKYAGLYVALDGDHLVATGKTLPEAANKAKRAGVAKPFLVRLTSETEVVFGGW